MQRKTIPILKCSLVALIAPGAWQKTAEDWIQPYSLRFKAVHLAREAGAQS
jgi:hypothetical protein